MSGPPGDLSSEMAYKSTRPVCLEAAMSRTMVDLDDALLAEAAGAVIGAIPR